MDMMLKVLVKPPSLAWSQLSAGRLRLSSLAAEARLTAPIGQAGWAELAGLGRASQVSRSWKIGFIAFFKGFIGFLLGFIGIFGTVTAFCNFLIVFIVFFKGKLIF